MCNLSLSKSIMSCGGFRQHSATKKDTYIIDIQIISGHIRTKRAGHPSKFQELQDPSRSGKEGKGSAPNPENHPAPKMWMHFFFENRWKETHFGWYHFKLCISNDIFKRLNQAIADQAAGQCVSLPGWAAGSAIPYEWIIVIPNRSVSIG